MSLYERKWLKEKPPVQSGMFRRMGGPMSEPSLPSDPSRPVAGTPTPAQGEPPAPPETHPDGLAPGEASPADGATELPRLQTPRRGRRLARPAPAPAAPLTAGQRLLILDTWRRSGLPAGDFAPLVGLS